MNLRTTLVLLALAVAATIGVEFSLVGRHAWFVGDRNQPFASYRKEFFREIRIDGGNRSIVLVGAGNDWVLQEPIAFPARLSTVERVIRLIRHLRVRGDLGRDDGSYGIAEAKLAVTFVDGAGDMTKIRFGDEVQIGDRRFVHFEHDGRVSWCDVPVRDALRDLTVAESRDDALTTIYAAQARKLVIEHADGPRVALESDPAVGWQVTEPYVTRAAPEEVIHTVSVLNAWAIEEYVLDGVLPEAAPTSFGLANPRFRVELYGTNDTCDVLLVGEDLPTEEDHAPQFVYVAWEGKPFVFRALRDPIELLRRSADAYRSRDLFALPSPDIDWIEIRNDQRVRIELTGANREKMTVDGSSETYPVDRDFIVQIIEVLREAKVDQFIPRDDELKAQQYELISPHLVIGIKPRDGKVDELRVGRRVRTNDAESDGHQRDDLHFLWNRRWETHYATGVVPLGQMLWRVPYSLRSPIVHDLPMPAVGRFSVRVPGHEVRSFVRPSTNWFRESDRKMVDKADHDDLLTLIYAMVATEWRAAEVGDPGPDSYELALEVGRPGMANTKFWVGAEIEGRPGDRWVRYDSSDWVFLYRSGELSPNPARFLIHFARGE